MNLLISLDGIAAEDAAKAVDSFVEAGYSAVKRLRTTFPAVTYPAHVSVMTGRWPNEHGIFENVISTNLPVERIPLYQADRTLCGKVIHVKTVFESLREEGLHVKADRWPLADGLASEWIREAEPAESRDRESESEVAVQQDEAVVQRLCQSIRNQDCDLLAVHFLQYDEAGHTFGCDGIQAEQAKRNLFQYVKKIGDLAAEHQCNAIFFSDHGMVNRTETIFPNRVLEREGFGEAVREKRLAFVCDGSGSAPLYGSLTNAERERIVELFRELPQTAAIWEIEESAADNTVPPLVVEFKEGVCAEDRWDHEAEQYPEMKGLHGYSSQHVSRMDGFLMAVGPDIRRGVVLSEGGLIDLAPTVSALCGSEYPCSGRILEEIILEKRR